MREAAFTSCGTRVVATIPFSTSSTHSSTGAGKVGAGAVGEAGGVDPELVLHRADGSHAGEALAGVVLLEELPLDGGQQVVARRRVRRGEQDVGDGVDAVRIEEDAVGQDAHPGVGGQRRLGRLDGRREPRPGRGRRGRRRRRAPAWPARGTRSAGSSRAREAGVSPSAAAKAARIASNRARLSWRSASALASPGSATSLGMGSRVGPAGAGPRRRARRRRPGSPGRAGGTRLRARRAGSPRRGAPTGPRRGGDGSASRGRTGRARRSTASRPRRPARAPAPRRSRERHRAGS